MRWNLIGADPVFGAELEKSRQSKIDIVILMAGEFESQGGDVDMLWEET